MSRPETGFLLADNIREELAVHMYNEGHFGIAEHPEDYITLKSGRQSPHYFDIRQGLSSPHTRELIGEAMVGLAIVRTDSLCDSELPSRYKHFVGSPEAMTSYAATAADLARMPLLQPRVDRNKKTGNKAPVLGRFEHGDRVAAFDDVVTDGATKVDMINDLSSFGLVVADYFVVLDREEGGAADVEEATGIGIIPALGLATTVSMLRANGLVSQTQFDNVREYMEQYGDAHAVAALAV